MKITVGERIFKDYMHYDSLSYYEFQDSFGETKFKRLAKSKRTKGKFKSVAVNYLFCLNKYNIYCLSTGVQFDSSLTQTGTIATYFIPEYVLRNTECNFISDSAAIVIAKTKFNQRGIKPISASLTYDHIKKLYIWQVDNVLTKNIDSFGNSYGLLQLAEIDALSGKIIKFYPDAIYGPVY